MKLIFSGDIGEDKRTLNPGMKSTGMVSIIRTQKVSELMNDFSEQGRSFWLPIPEAGNRYERHNVKIFEIYAMITIKLLNNLINFFGLTDS